MKEKKRSPIAISIVLILINTIAAFYVSGSPQDRIGMEHFTYNNTPTLTEDIIILNEDVAGTSEEGGDHLYKAGERLQVTGYDPEDNSPIVMEFEGMEVRSYTLHDADYENVTEEIRSQAMQYSQEGSRLYKDYRYKRALWFMNQGVEIKNPAGTHLGTIEGSFKYGITGAAIIFVIEAVLLALSRLTKKSKIFYVPSAGLLLAMTALIICVQVLVPGFR
jgi:hypothetical protein